MKKNNIIIAALILLNIFTLFKLNSLENSMNNYRQESQNQLNNLRNEIQNIYSNVDSKLKEQASLLDSYEITFGDKMNSENFTVPITVSVTPKELSEGLNANLLINNEKFAMKKNGTIFSTTVDALIFDNNEIKVILEKNGVEKVETIEEYQNIQYKYLLGIWGHYLGDTKFSSGIFKYDGDANLFIDAPQENSPEKISIVQYLNDKVIDEQQVDFTYDPNKHDPFIIPIKGEVKLAADDKLSVYAKVQDKYGLVYKYVILYYEIDSQGNLVKNRPEWANGTLTEITDKDGNILFNYLEKH